MRLLANRQRSLAFYPSPPSLRQEWEQISAILDANPEMVTLVWQDLTTDAQGNPKKDAGARGMTAEQVLRFAVVKTKEQLSYRDLRDRVEDSFVLGEFCRLGAERAPGHSTLQENIKRIRPQTWEALNGVLIGYAVAQGIEDGKRVRLDTTGIEANVHAPSDGHQLWDGVRVLARTLQGVETDLARLRGRFHDHRRAAKKAWFGLANARGEDRRQPFYKKLLQAAGRTVSYARAALEELAVERCETFEESVVAAGHAQTLSHFVPLVEKVIEQTRRRVLRGEDVPAREKILSIFEAHTDIIKKGQRAIVYGHKVLFTGGKSNLILACAIERGNPADNTQFESALDRHAARFGHAPEQVAADAGFASQANARAALERGVKDVVFVAPKHKTLPELIRATRAYKALRRWRAGIEGIISAGKRAFGLDRCTWSGFESFCAYVHLGVLAFNLQTLARHRLA